MRKRGLCYNVIVDDLRLYKRPFKRSTSLKGLLLLKEYTFELAWKTMKDYLEQEGFDVKSPRKTIQTAFQIQLITDGHLWIDALEKRNLMEHTYDEKKSNRSKRINKEKILWHHKELKEYIDRVGKIIFEK
ncbi:nucleotidyltransferase substrate binding protein, HI0074 family [Paramaledivibacter caminithermalis DSM 15212]|uniref:Nucleotidyltransferase substrate binding protein, HI0074 family n=1 Tax=Paramaledivibacter caminithermalis (strain DSM 15212 / CIP 107654 / DViRD3) TaxID=1121301 RepID=A0A1M6KEF2_PARC5|nr:nucleotidyltransferase substrate binding protein, HI0074 family [Paramaledivibacter caminithermalis DSM 15212]